MARFTEPILHVDMDPFFVEVERLRQPALRGRPVVVGGLGRRGVVASASYEARRHGVRAAMTMGEARRRCPGARFLPPDHARYRDASRRVFAVLGDFTPLVEQVAIDAAYLDVGGLHLHFPTPVAVAVAMRTRLRDELGLPASVGVASTQLIAKLASEAAKPDGLVRVDAGREIDFLHPLPVRALPGVGAATLAALEGLGVETIGDLAALPSSRLRRSLGDALADVLEGLARGELPAAPATFAPSPTEPSPPGAA